MPSESDYYFDTEAAWKQGTDAKAAGLDLTGKAVVVTGAGRGLGSAVAQAAAAAGAAVVVNDLDVGPAESCAALIRAAGGTALVQISDLSVWSEAEGLIERCLREYGKIDGLVNNAGIHIPTRSWEMEEAKVRKQIDVNVLGTLATAGRALKAMIAQGSGSVVNTTSGAQFGIAWRPDYSASKGAVSSFTYTAALELEGTGVRVNAMSPNVESRMVGNTQEFFKLRGQERPKAPPLPSAAANVGIHLYLLADRSKHVNGQVLGIRPDGEFYIASHPAILEPGLKGSGLWTAAQIADAVETGKVAPLQPLGPARMRLVTT
jgi:NAD(P)-dependent dehydrogenase (short-subunit alcohol dehydrogenase family)